MSQLEHYLLNRAKVREFGAVLNVKQNIASFDIDMR